jgi:hypothetical protein
VIVEFDQRPAKTEFLRNGAATQRFSARDFDD